jgi:8-oxo-dGTP pyrophosphatase MutT (NUDIX family)
MDYIKYIRGLVGHKPINLNGVKVLLFDESGRLLLQKRADGIWDLPGGIVELGETLEGAAIREVAEETGLVIKDLTLFHVFSGPDYFVKLRNGDQFYAITTVYTTKEFAGEPQADGVEGVELAFFFAHEFPDQINPRMKRIIDYFFNKALPE